MNLREYAKRIIATTSDDWTILTCWGFGSGPSYLESSSVEMNGQGDFSNIEIESHGMRASLKSDLSIWIAWGYPSNPEFREPWANQFPDSQASSHILDFFYNDVLVFRDIYVDVDGGRCYLPLPERELYPETREIRRYTVARDKYAFFKMFDSFERMSDFERYFKEADFYLVDASWIV